MRQKLAVSLLLLLQLAAVCNGRATKTSTKEDALDTLAKRLKSLIADKELETREDLNDELDEKDEAEIEKSYKYSKYESRDGGMTTDQIKKVIHMHNKLRHGEGASDMQRLHYSSKLAKLAQDWANGCSWGHRPHGSFVPTEYGFSSVGENIWAWSDDSKKIPEDPIQDWFNEKDFYVYDSTSCQKEPCGHYTQVVWSSTREVGCGLAKCGTLQNAGFQNAMYFVCNYGPGGNAAATKPYTKGAGCSACSTGKFYCTNRLCDDACTSSGSGGRCECKANCVHGTQTSDCKCKCQDGYMGVSCNDECKNLDSQCGAGWPEMMCEKPIFSEDFMKQVIQQCPKMCKTCVSAKRSDKKNALLEYLEKMAEEKK